MFSRLLYVMLRATISVVLYSVHFGSGPITLMATTTCRSVLCYLSKTHLHVSGSDYHTRKKKPFFPCTTCVQVTLGGTRICTTYVARCSIAALSKYQSHNMQYCVQETIYMHACWSHLPRPRYRNALPPGYN